jgi:regulator of protease activity HflC (stomatin/prohibitin superfamily)
MINFEILRLDNSQTYFSFPVRTKDNVVVNLKLMIFYEVSHLENLIKNTHDPMCEFYNKLQATITSEIAKKSFDNFKNDTGDFISELSADKDLNFEGIGLSIDEIVLREWEPQERRVQDILEKAAMVESQK